MLIIEHSSSSYAPRTYHNAGTADLTVAFAIDFNTAGERLTQKAAKEKYVAVPLSMDPIVAARRLYAACKRHNVKKLNVAGNGIYSLVKKGWTQQTLNQWVFDVISLVHTHWPLESIISGGQTGVDLAGGVVGEVLALETVMTLPNGYLQRNADGADITQSVEDVVENVMYYVELLKKDKDL